MTRIIIFDQCKRTIAVNKNMELHVENFYLDPANYKLNKNYAQMVIQPNETCLIVLSDAKLPQFVWRNNRFEVQNSNVCTNLAAYLVENTMPTSSVALPNECTLSALFTFNVKIKNIPGYVNLTDLLPLFSKQ